MKTAKYNELIRETKKAWLLEYETFGKLWFPKSECKIDKKNKTLTMPNWLAKQKLWLTGNSNSGDFSISNTIEDEILGTMDWCE